MTRKDCLVARREIEKDLIGIESTIEIVSEGNDSDVDDSCVLVTIGDGCVIKIYTLTAWENMIASLIQRDNPLV